MILAFLSGAAVLTAHEGVERGPNGGRILEFSKDETMHGEVTVKLGFKGERLLQIAPEFESCRAIAERAGVPLREVQLAATEVARATFQAR